MAKTFTMKVSRSGVWETFYPETVISQVVNLQSALDGKLNTSDRGATNGVAPLENGKIPTNYLPEAALGRSQLATTLNGTNWPRNPSGISGLSALTHILETLLGKTLSASNYIEFIGYYFIATETFNVKENIGTSGGQWIYPPTESTIQNADNIIVAGYDEEKNLLLYGLINNTYGYATQSSYGITRLGFAHNFSDLHNDLDKYHDVITKDSLFYLIKEGDLNGSDNEKIASSNHIHSQYQTLNTHLTNIINASKTKGNFLVGNGTTFVVENGAKARASLGVYSTTQIDNINFYQRNIHFEGEEGIGVVQDLSKDNNLYFSNIVDV